MGRTEDIAAKLQGMIWSHDACHVHAHVCLRACVTYRRASRTHCWALGRDHPTLVSIKQRNATGRIAAIATGGRGDLLPAVTREHSESLTREAIHNYGTNTMSRDVSRRDPHPSLPVACLSCPCSSPPRKVKRVFSEPQKLEEVPIGVTGVDKSGETLSLSFSAGASLLIVFLLFLMIPSRPHFPEFGRWPGTLLQFLPRVERQCHDASTGLLKTRGLRRSPYRLHNCSSLLPPIALFPACTSPEAHYGELRAGPAGAQLCLVC